MRKLMLLIGLVLAFTRVNGQNHKLAFNKNGEFKIIQFTDLHIEAIKSGADSEAVYSAISEIVISEKPDLVVLTGDVITQDPMTSALLKLAHIFEENKVPWTSVLGNHDEECSHIERKKLAAIHRSMPYNINSNKPGIMGETNFILTVKGAGKIKSLLYFFDSNAYNPMKGKVNTYYAWMDFSQVQWYRNQSIAFTKKNGGTPVSALAFFHIPFPEYDDLWRNDSIHCIGTKAEPVASPKVNSGMYLSMLECGDVMGTFVGHDHNNDYIGTYNNIALAYGRCTRGISSYGLFPQGGRVIVLKEGKREFDTWIHEKGGNITHHYHYPNSIAPVK